MQKKYIFDWNHISNKLTRSQIEELKSYYKTYHRKSWAFKMAAKRIKKWKLLGNSMSVIFASGGIVAAIPTGSISLVAISTASIMIQTWMKHKKVDLKIHSCTFAYQNYEHLLNEIIDALRSGEFNRDDLLSKMNIIDNYIVDITPVVDKYLKKYDNKFSA